MKHQSRCYRILKGVKCFNYSDLAKTDAENQEIIKEAKNKYKTVRKIKHPWGFYQLFVGNPKTEQK